MSDSPDSVPRPEPAPNCDQCGQVTNLLTTIPRLGDQPTYRIFQCDACRVLKWIAEQIT